MKERSLLAVLVSLLAALVLVAAGCGGDDGEAPPVADEEPVAEEISVDLSVGVVTSFTGDLSPFGEPIDQAARIAAEVANEAAEAAGMDASIEIVASEDDQTDPTAGVEAATKLIQTDQVQVIIGSLASTVTIPIAESVTVPNQVVQISPASTAVAISELADDGFLWRTPPSDAAQAPILADQVAAAFGADATINTGARNDAYGVGLVEGFEAAWQELGGTIGASVQWNPEGATFDSEAQQLAGGNPDGWVIIDFPETWARMGPALVRTGGWDPELTFTADGLRNTELPGDVGDEATEGMRGTAPSPGAGVTPAGDAFDTLFQERAAEGVSRQVFDAQAFDAVLLAFLAAVAANSNDPADIRDNLQAVSGPEGEQFTFEDLAGAITALANGEEIDYEGASGPIDFDENGDPTAAGAVYEVWQFEGGEITTLENVPFEGE